MAETWDISLKNADGDVLLNLEGFADVYKAEEAFLAIAGKHIVSDRNNPYDTRVCAYCLFNHETGMKYKLEPLM
jgi:hypothetical protein